MERFTKSFQRAPKESLTKAKKNLKESRKEAVLVLKQHVVLALIKGAQVGAFIPGGEEQAGFEHGELPHWNGSINRDDMIAFSVTNAESVAADRRRIIQNEILPRKKKLGIPPFEKRQHTLVRNKIKELAEELGVSEELVLQIADVQMQAAVDLQKKAKARKNKPSRVQKRAA